MGDSGSEASQLELVKIPNARLLVLEDEPKLADEAIVRFVKENPGRAKKGLKRVGAN